LHQKRTVDLDDWNDIPKACHKIDRNNEMILTRRLIQNGMGPWLPYARF
jgi:hypothetical protein